MNELMINDIKIMFFVAINALNMILGLTNVVMIFVRCDMIVRIVQISNRNSKTDNSNVAALQIFLSNKQLVYNLMMSYKGCSFSRQFSKPIILPFYLFLGVLCCVIKG